ncbi:MAG: PAS domain S-box protein [Gammaproteobacteria bacterium]|nr:PAS domain S-box protein [Gammaproteobacteria bacterium]
MANKTEEPREIEQITSAIEDGFGICPSFFMLAADSPAVVRHLYEQAKFAYLEAPFPALFKEELFAYLSRFCMAPYCMLRHSAFLIERPAGDQASATLSPADVVQLLQTPLPSNEQLLDHLDVLRRAGGLQTEGLMRGSKIEKAVFFGGVSLFLQKGPFLAFKTELRRFLGATSYFRFCTFLAFIRTAHYWTELHETLSVESDVDQLLIEEPALASWLNNYRENVAVELEANAENIIAELKLAVKHTEAQRAGLSHIIETSLNEIYIFSAETLGFVQVNEGARKNLGYTFDELKALTPLDIECKYTAERFQALLDTLRTGQRQMLEYTARHRRKDGSEYPVEVHLQYMALDGTSMFVAIALDATEKRRTESALKESHELLEQRVLERTAELRESQQALKLALSAGKLHTFKHDLKTDRLIVSPEFDGPAGGSGAIGQLPDWLAALHPDDLPRFSEQYRRLTEEGQDLADEYRIPQPDGSVRWISLRAQGFKNNRGEVERIYGVLDDTTDTKLATAALEEAKSLAERATAAKSRFLMAASHDLRQPLQALGMYLATLTHQFDQPGLRHLTDQMRVSLDAMGELLNALLDISRFEGGSVTPNKRDFHLGELLERVVTNNIQQAEKKGLQLDYTREDCVLHSDPALLERVIDNLLINAIRYTERGRVSVDCQCSHGIARITVTDTGIGITSDALEKIFEEYYQLDNPARDRRKGLGLGLSIVKHIARLLDHPFDVHSIPGQGSTFSVSVPVGNKDTAQREPRAQAEPAPHGNSKPRVLLVDDDPFIVYSTKLLLESTGAQVNIATNGSQALATLDAGFQPDFVISDYWLPGLSGIDLIRRVREVAAKEIPAVVITGDMAVPEVEMANLTNCTILHKPVDPNRLISMIENLSPARA